MAYAEVGVLLFDQFERVCQLQVVSAVVLQSYLLGIELLHQRVVLFFADRDARVCDLCHLNFFFQPNRLVNESIELNLDKMNISEASHFKLFDLGKFNVSFHLLELLFFSLSLFALFFELLLELDDHERLWS